MYRKYIKDLIYWNNNRRRKPLVVWGARQAGKTFLIRDLFAEEYYPNNYIYIDCNVENDIVRFCETHSNVDDVINYISLDKGRVINEKTLLIFDEVQECLPIITLLKYFCQEHREIPVIVTGSMVRIKIQRETRKRGVKSGRQFLFPVGKINQLTIYPMDFEEFLFNSNQILYKKIQEAYVNKTALNPEAHHKALDYFYSYLLVGGMPEAVDVFLESGSYQESREVLADIYDNYLTDMELYQASPESVVRAKKIFENIYALLNKESKNFKSTMIEPGAKGRDMRTPIEWLTLAHIILQSSLVKERVTIPLIDSEESLHRLYLADIGMFSYQSGINAKTFLSNDGRNTLSGIFFENYVACELARSGHKLFYWKGKGDAEFEFLVEHDSVIIPIDVKKGRGTLNSLEKYKNHNKVEVVIKVSANNYGYEEQKKILTIPFYMLFSFLNSLSKGEINIAEEQ